MIAGPVAFSTTENSALLVPAAAVQVVRTADGEVALPATAGSEFSGNGLPAGWQVTYWPSTLCGTATVSNNLLSVDGAQAGTQALYGPGHEVEFKATFSGDPFQHVGFGTDFSNGSPWAIFSTNTGGQLYTRTSTGTLSQDTLLPGNWLGAQHDFDINWTATGVTYAIDGTQVASDAIAVSSPMRPLVGDLQPGGGAVVVASMILSPPGYDVEFAGSTLPADWTTTGGQSAVNVGQLTVGGGQLTVDGTLTGPQALYAPGRSLEFVATFSGDAYQHVGFGTDDNSSPWALFSTYTGGALYARTNAGAGGAQDTLLPGNWLGAPHDFRIDWEPTSVTYSIDGNAVASHPLAVSASMRPTVSDFQPGGGVVSVDWLRMSPYGASGSFFSHVLDAGHSTAWGTASWNASTPVGTSIAVSVRVGNTPAPDATWTAFQPLSGSGAAIPGTGRYVQYRADLATTDQALTPSLASVTLTTANAAASFTDTTAADFAAGSLGTGILANDSDGNGDPLTAVLVSGPAHGALSLNADGSFAYTPVTNFFGTDSFVYQAEAPDGTLSAPATVTIQVAPVVHTPTLTAANASGNEGSPIPLSISAAPGVSDGSETLALALSGLPTGAVLSHGTLSGGTWTLTPADLAGLTATLPDNGTFALTVTATERSVATGATATATATATLTAANVAPTATLPGSVSASYGNAVTVSFTGQHDISSADTTAGFHYAFALNANGLTSATYGNSGTVSSASFANLTVGTYTVYGRVIDKDDGYTQYSSTATVTKATLTVTAAPASKVYGAPLPALTASYSGFVYGDTAANLTGSLSLAPSATAASPVGSYAITPGGLSSTNYQIVYVGATLQVTKAALVVTADNQSVTFGSPLPHLTAHYSGFVNGDTAASLTSQPTLSTSATAVSPLGAYAITAGGAASSNYTITYVPGALTLTAPAQGVAVLAPDPLNPGQQALFVSGTAGDDFILVTGLSTSCGTLLWVHISAANAPFGPSYDAYFTSPVSRIVVHGQAGNDDAGVVGIITAPSWLYGDDGNDRLLTATLGNNVLLGGAGNDLLVGGAGRDLLIGGSGSDQLIGNGGDDILVAGTTAFDANDAALQGIMAEWTSGHDYATRLSNLTDTGAGLLGRYNGAYFLLDSGPSQTVFNDNSTDTLTGSSGSDWFFAGAADKITDLSASDRAFIFGT